MADPRLTDRADVGLLYDIEQGPYTSAQTANATRERTVAHDAGCPPVGYEIDGVAAGGAVFDGRELHLAVPPQFHGRWAWLLKPTLDWLFALCDPVRVRIEHENARWIRFTDSGGWERVAEDRQYIAYLLSSSTPHVFRRRRARQGAPD